jgi:hypothetical protein
LYVWRLCGWSAPHRSRHRVKPSAPRSTALASITEPAPSGYRSWDAFWKAQNQLLAGAEQIRSAAQDNNGFLSDYSDLSIDNQLHQINLYWKGTIPSVVRAAVASVDARVPVKVHQAAYDWHELETSARALLNPESGESATLRRPGTQRAEHCRNPARDRGIGT